MSVNNDDNLPIMLTRMRLEMIRLAALYIIFIY